MKRIFLPIILMVLFAFPVHAAKTTLTENLVPSDHDDVVDRVNEIASEQNAMNTELYGKYAPGTEADWYGTILAPDAVYTNGPNVTIAADVPAAFTITQIDITCDADPTTEITITFKHKAKGVGYGTPTTIEAVTTTAGTATVTSGIDDATIAAGVKMFFTLSDPDDALLECAWQIEGDWD